MSEVIARFNENKILFIKNEIIEEIDMPLPTFTRNSVAYLSDGTQVAANQPRFEPGKFEKAVMVEEGTTNKYSANHSQGLSPLNFNGSVVNVTSGQLDPFGGTNAVRIQASGGTSTLKAVYNAYAPASGVACSGQIWVRNRSITQLIVHSNQGGRQETVLQSDGWKKIIWENIIGNGYGILQHQLRVPSVDDEIDCDVAFLQYEEKPYCTSWQIGGTARAAETLTIPTEGVLNPQEGTVECWVYNPLLSLGKARVIFDVRDANGDRMYLEINPNHQLNAVTYISGQVFAAVSSPLTLGWHYVAMTWDSNSIICYVDGKMAATRQSPQLLDSAVLATIGSTTVSRHHFNSFIDDLRISNRARTDEEILAAYQSGKPLSVDKYTTYKLDFNDKLNPTKDISSFQFSADGDLYLPEIIEELDMTEPTFTRNSIAYLSDGTQVAANQPRFEQGKFGKAVMVEEGTTNSVLNPSFESDLTNWTVSGAQVSIDTTKASHGGKSAKLVANATNIYLYQRIIVSPGQIWSVSAYIETLNLTGSYLVFKTQWFNNGVFVSRAGAINVSGTSAMSRRIHANLTVPTGVNQLHIEIQLPPGVLSGIAWVDAVQAEQKPYVTSFIDGTRATETLTIPTAGVLNPQEGTIECWVYVNTLIKDISVNRNIFECRFGGGAQNIILLRHSNGNRWVIMVSNASGQITSGDVSDTLSIGWHYFVIRWSAIELTLFIDGTKVINTDNPYLPSVFASNAILGYDSVYQGYINTCIDDLRISSRARTDEEILAAYQSNKPLPVDKDTTYKLGFDNSLNPNKNINTIQIDKNRILFIPEFEERVDF